MTLPSRERPDVANRRSDLDSAALAAGRARANTTNAFSSPIAQPAAPPIRKSRASTHPRCRPVAAIPSCPRNASASEPSRRYQQSMSGSSSSSEPSMSRRVERLDRRAARSPRSPATSPTPDSPAASRASSFVAVNRDSHDLAARLNPTAMAIRLHRRRRCACRDPPSSDAHEDVLPRVDELLGSNANSSRRTHAIRQKSLDSPHARDRPAQLGPRHAMHRSRRLGRSVAKHASRSPRSYASPHFAHDLHVLLRHRLLLEARRLRGHPLVDVELRTARSSRHGQSRVRGAGSSSTWCPPGVRNRERARRRDLRDRRSHLSRFDTSPQTRPVPPRGPKAVQTEMRRLLVGQASGRGSRSPGRKKGATTSVNAAHASSSRNRRDEILPCPGQQLHHELHVLLRHRLLLSPTALRASSVLRKFSTGRADLRRRSGLPRCFAPPTPLWCPRTHATVNERGFDL